MMTETDHYAVMGNPIAHSKSPRIHAMFAGQTGEALDYNAILVEPGTFPTAVEKFQHEGGKGLNVTVPFKQEAFALADNLSPRAERAGAVNTLVLEPDGEIVGDNTDGIGLVNDLTHNRNIGIAGQRLLLLGAGGAARGVIGPLLEEDPARLVIANRTVAKAEELAGLFADMGQIKGCGFDDLADSRFDVIINATAAGLLGEVPALPERMLSPETVCYDMMYGNQPTAFMDWSTRLGVTKSMDGLGMLVEQAAESFYVWRGVRPKTGSVIAALRKD